MAKVNKYQNGDTKNFAIGVGKTRYFSTENITVSGRITKLEAIKMQFV